MKLSSARLATSVSDGVRSTNADLRWCAAFALPGGYASPSLADFEALVRERFLMIDPETALAEIPAMLPSDMEVRTRAFDVIKQVLTAARRGLNAEEAERAARIAKLIGLDRGAASRRLSLLTLVFQFCW